MTVQKSVQHKFKKDKYVKARGGNSHFLDLFCGACGQHLMLYQKDGHGSLIRLYLDRIFDPKELSELQLKNLEKKEMQGLKCSNCHCLIGLPMVYELERRLAFRLIRGSLVKEKSEGIYPPLKQNLNFRNTKEGGSREKRH